MLPGKQPKPAPRPLFSVEKTPVSLPRAPSATQLQQTTFLQEPFFGAQLAVKQEIIEIPEKEHTTVNAGGYTIQKGELPHG